MNENTTDDIQSVQGTTPDLQTEFAKKLSELAPELLADGKIDSKKLKELLDGDEADDSERFGLFWPGKKRAMRAAQEPTTATLKPAKDESKDWDTTQNLFIEGDNLEVLKVLQKHYHNKIKMIYIDPPYNTGKDFVYPDNYKEGLASYLEFTKQVDEGGKRVSTNSDTDGRYHSNWLNMIYPRLKLARNLLSNDGIIFLSIGDDEVDNLKKVCNEIFGESRFIAQFVWKSRAKPTNAGDSKYRPQKVAEYILAYARMSGDEIKLRPGTGEDRTYPHHDENGDYRTTTILTSNRGTFRRETMRFALNDFVPPSEQRWKAGKEEIEKLFNSGRVAFRNGSPFRKIYKQDEEEILTPLYTFVDSSISGTAENGKAEVTKLLGNTHGFDTVKPLQLMEYLISISTSDEDIVMDLFSGSGTTGHAVMRLNAKDGSSRRHIQIQIPEPTDPDGEARSTGYMNVADITMERVRRAGEKILSEFSDKLNERDIPLDVGFKVFQLAESNFTKWQSQSDTDKDSLQQHLLDIRESSNNAATEEDLLTEVLLKQGVSLTAPISHTDVAGLSVWTVGDNLVCAYLNEKQKPNLDQLRAIAANEPAKLIVLEDAFQGDDELKTNLHQICKSQKIELWTV